MWGRSAILVNIRNDLALSTLLKMAANVSSVTHCSKSGDLSIRAQKRKKAHQHYVKKNKLKEVSQEDENMNETEYYFENGLRKVYPYYYKFSAYAKGRWVGKTISDVYGSEFYSKSKRNVIDDIETGRIMVNGKKVKPDLIIKFHDRVEHLIHRHENPVVGGPIQIIANTPDLVAINKPASIPCHPCSRYRYNSVTFILGMEHGLKNLKTLYRLDRLTSGILVLPKTLKMSQKWEKQLANKEFYKEYVCRVEGEFPEETITCNESIEVLSHSFSIFKVGPKGKPSTTTFTRMSYNGTSSVVKCIPQTGRSHQIRIHLQYLGYPILNDPIYNRAIYGKNKGKDGVIENSVDEIIEDIKNGTNVGRWQLGVNPKYAEFLEKRNAAKHGSDYSNTTIGISYNDKGISANSQKSLNEMSVTKGTSNDDVNNLNSEVDNKKVTSGESNFCGEKTDSSVSEDTSSSMRVGKIYSGRGENDLSSDKNLETDDGAVRNFSEKNIDLFETEERPCKKFKLDNEPDVCNSIESKVVSDQSGSFHEIKKVPEDGAEIITEVNKENRLDCDIVNKIEELPCDEVMTLSEVNNEETVAGGEVNVDCPETIKTTEFDERKMTYEENCVECMYLYKDPSPADMLLYLHAVRYKGPDWEYSTPLPDWAQPDWKED